MIAREKRRAYRDCEYWGKPVPGFGDAHAQLLIVGLAPGAHGSNRTGRMFTGDRSGDFLYGALFQAGFANQPTALHRDDDLRLINAYITATARCAPPDNKPLPQELVNCRDYLQREIGILKPRAVLALGKIAWDSCLKTFSGLSLVSCAMIAPAVDVASRVATGVPRAAVSFAHGVEVELQPLPSDSKTSPPRLFGVYHPSQQNTQTGLLTAEMYAQVLTRIQLFLSS
ncbi:MAG: uracil-DNA glycosylase family protein [Candidatus Acidiferrum sp.]